MIKQTDIQTFTKMLEKSNIDFRVLPEGKENHVLIKHKFGSTFIFNEKGKLLRIS